jgi:hypothetical protein
MEGTTALGIEAESPQRPRRFGGARTCSVKPDQFLNLFQDKGNAQKNKNFIKTIIKSIKKK